MTRPVRSILMWAAIRNSSSGNEWIHPDTVRRIRSEAKAAYLSTWNSDPQTVKWALSMVRFARVEIRP